MYPYVLLYPCRMPFTDQGELKMLHLRYYPKIKVDSLSLIFTKRNYYLNEL